MPSFCRIEGSNGYIIVEGSAPSTPDSFTVFSKDGCSVKSDWQGGRGSFREADAVALNIAAGRKENTVMRIIDIIRKQGGARFARDHD
jgi:hypothetical protein